jgi:hypothetical protein
VKVKNYPITGLGRLLGLQEVEAPRIFRHSAHEGGKVVSPTQPSEMLLVLGFWGGGGKVSGSQSY